MGPRGKAAALDWAVSSGLQDKMVRKTAQLSVGAGDHTTRFYEIYKKNFRPEGISKSTRLLCEENGLDFHPLVIEQHGGGWGNELKHIVQYVAGGVARVWNTDLHLESKKLAQQISLTLQLENARAICDRYPEPGV